MGANVTSEGMKIGFQFSSKLQLIDTNSPEHFGLFLGSVRIKCWADC